MLELLLVAATLLGAISGHAGVFVVALSLLSLKLFPVLLLVVAVAGLIYHFINNED